MSLADSTNAVVDRLCTQALAHDFVLDALTLTRFRYTAHGVRHHMAMEPWHRVELAAPRSTH